MQKINARPEQALDQNHAHHQFAAENHGLASRHYSKAEGYFQSGNYQMAAHHAHIAHGYSLHALRHGEEATRRYAEAYGPLADD